MLHFSKLSSGRAPKPSKLEGRVRIIKTCAHVLHNSKYKMIIGAGGGGGGVRYFSLGGGHCLTVKHEHEHEFEHEIDLTV